ncbi:MAG TPA: hydantoinase/oxoprolinase family protein [Acetobacteraceae bacterium]|jgi:N-methylhydantoinase A
MFQLAFDIGGTFTDFALSDRETGTLAVWKVLTTPGRPATAVIESLAERIATGRISPAAIADVLHATTIATNAILERKGSRTALITTSGFRDVLIIGRQKRHDTNSLHIDKPAPLIERADIFEVPERMAPDGSVVTPFDMVAARDVAMRLSSSAYRSVAVAFLHAYANPAHERQMAALLAAVAPDLAVTLSSELSPKFREYERTSTAVANAYVKPLVESYVAELQDALRKLGIGAELAIMQSNGGLMSAAQTRGAPIRIVESGPAAGVLMAARVGAEEGASHVISFDMGGTTTKLGAIDDGVPVVTPTFEVDAVNYRPGSGLPLNVTAIELLEIGAGGGSLARTRMGMISVGPDSAGADPGPICYGRGGDAATLTDANLVLGYLDPDYFNGGAMRLDCGAAAAGIARDVAAPLGLPLQQAAWGIHSVANANMERAMRVVSIERGRDPRRYALVAFGGAGPLHAARLARALGIPRVIVPRAAGVGSALGLLSAEHKVDAGLTRVLRLEENAREAIAAVFAEMEARLPRGVRTLARAASMHHVGQGFEIRVDLPSGVIDVAAMREAFFARYRQEYGYVDRETPIEATDWYIVATLGGAPTVSLRLYPRQREEGGHVNRPAYLPEAGGMVATPVIDRGSLQAGNSLPGPALIEEAECTTLVLPGDTAVATSHGNLVIDIGAGR